MVEVSKDSSRIGYGSTYFRIPEAHIVITPVIPGIVKIGNNTFSFGLEPINLTGVPSGILEVSLNDPDGTEIWTGSEDFGIIEGQIITVDFQLLMDELLFGNYSLIYKLTYGANMVTGEREIQCSSLVTVSFDKPFYRARETMQMSVNITNDGQLLIENAGLDVSIPDTGYNYSGTLTLSPNQSKSFTLYTAITDDLSPGTHHVSVILSLNNSMVRDFRFAVPAPKLALDLDEIYYSAGEGFHKLIQMGQPNSRMMAGMWPWSPKTALRKQNIFMATLSMRFCRWSGVGMPTIILRTRWVAFGT